MIEKLIRFGTFKIQNSRNRGLKLALRRMDQRRFNCGVFKETNLTKGVYARELSGFRLMATEAPSAHRGGLAIFYCKEEHFAVEELSLHVPNVIRFKLMTGRWWWHVVGYYIAPSDASTIEDVAAVIRDQLYGDEILAAGKLNSDIAEPEGTSRGEAIAYELAAAGLEDMGMQFLPRSKPWLQDMCTWSMMGYEREVRPGRITSS